MTSSGTGSFMPRFDPNAAPPSATVVRAPVLTAGPARLAEVATGVFWLPQSAFRAPEATHLTWQPFGLILRPYGSLRRRRRVFPPRPDRPRRTRCRPLPRFPAARIPGAAWLRRAPRPRRVRRAGAAAQHHPRVPLPDARTVSAQYLAAARSDYRSRRHPAPDADAPQG